MARPRKTSTSTYAPEAPFTVGECATHWQAIRPLLKARKHLTIDLSTAGRVDTAGLQMLLLARRELTQEERTLRVVGWPLGDGETALLGVTSGLQQPPASEDAALAGEE